MVRSTSALLDTAAVRSLLDRPTARALLSRFGGSDSWSDDPDDTAPTEAEGAEGVEPDVMADVPGVPKLGGFEVMNRTIEIAQSALARHTLAAYPPTC
jgi:NTE family protein